MKWYELSVHTTQAGLEIVAARFDMLGITQLVIEESRESVGAFLEENAKYWDYAELDELVSEEGPCVRAYVAALGENEALLREAEASFAALAKEDLGVDLGSLRFTCLVRDEEDWANNWKRYYKPLPIGEGLLICPSWEEAGVAGAGRAVLSMDPGMAFGTGSHHTTRMCLEYLDAMDLEGKRLLDLGCGSGVLSIAALLLGAASATAVDIDPVAAKIARENAQRNGIGEERYTVCAGDALTDGALRKQLAAGRYDVVSANIVADVIIALCPLVRDCLRPEGRFLCSGVIAERLAEVLAALKANGFAVIEEKAAEDWRAILAKRL